MPLQYMTKDLHFNAHSRFQAFLLINNDLIQSYKKSTTRVSYALREIHFKNSDSTFNDL